MARITLPLLAFWALVVVTQLALASQLAEQSTAVSSVSVEGIVFCDQCLQNKITKSSNLLKGAQVALLCDSQSEKGAEAVVVAVTTDEKGRFVAVLPAAAFDGTGQISCAAELRQSPRKSCQLPATPRRTSTEFSRQEPVAGKLVYSVGTLSYRPESAGMFCAQASYYSPEYKPPVYKPPVEKPPMEKPPVEKPPMEKPPVYKPPVEKPPMEKPPMEKPPVYKPPVEKPPVYKPPVEKPPIYKPPVEKPPIYKPPVEKPPSYSEPKFKFPEFRFPKFKFPEFQFPKFPKDKYPPKYPPKP